jgi:dCMP deaminase
MDWDTYFMEMANLVSTKSKDRSTQVGCVIVGPNHEVRTTGYNGFCRGIDDDVEERHERPEKYLWSEHAERNAIYNAARNGIRIEDCTAYTTVFPCADCARGLIQSGVVRIVTRPINNQKTSIPLHNYVSAMKMLDEADIDVDMIYDGDEIVPYETH